MCIYIYISCLTNYLINITKKVPLCDIHTKTAPFPRLHMFIALSILEIRHVLFTGNEISYCLQNLILKILFSESVEMQNILSKSLSKLKLKAEL